MFSIDRAARGRLASHESVSAPRCASRALRQRSSSLSSQPTRRSLTLILCGNLPARSKRPRWTLEKLMLRTGLSSANENRGSSTCVSSSEVHDVRGSRAASAEDERMREGRGMVEDDPLPKSTTCQDAGGRAKRAANPAHAAAAHRLASSIKTSAWQRLGAHRQTRSWSRSSCNAAMSDGCRTIQARYFAIARSLAASVASEACCDLVGSAIRVG